MDELLSEAARGLFRDLATPARIRAADAGDAQATAGIRRQVEEAGFADALKPEAQGGGGMDLEAAFPILHAAGYCALPLPLAELMFERAGEPFTPLAQAWSAAALMAGAMERVLEMTLQYANERSQFGKPLGKFQAIQQQLSVMAEQVFAARMAAQLACRQCAGARPDATMAAIGKLRASEAAAQVAAIAQAVHGAMGVTEEYDLQLFTRRLHAWRREGGAESHWARQVGAAVLAGPRRPMIEFLLERFA
ncbi:MAG: hypothetical protein MO847_06805 [Candidatus Protistobacter heckmanni]|nr:hypothetical protein [Candidatus Protistobacter heckmanni]